MNKKIKVIELLNLLAENKIEKATKIKYGRTIYIVDFPNLCGIYPEGGTTKVSESLFSNINILSLNDEVEILEDEEEIEELPELDTIHYSHVQIGQNRVKLNEIIKKVNELDKQINKEE